MKSFFSDKNQRISAEMTLLSNFDNKFIVESKKNSDKLKKMGHALCSDESVPPIPESCNI